ncbi:hypothetical protein DBP15_00775 [Streptomyces sp. CS065A]|nr:hypothetical protein DBP15_00775 [Streptomyces sp. CS065A]
MTTILRHPRPGFTWDWWAVDAHGSLAHFSDGPATEHLLAHVDRVDAAAAWAEGIRGQQQVGRTPGSRQHGRHQPRPRHGSFIKECEHPEGRWPKCPHDYKIRYRSAAGRQAEEATFSSPRRRRRPASPRSTRPGRTAHRTSTEPSASRSTARYGSSSTPPGGRPAGATSAPALGDTRLATELDRVMSGCSPDSVKVASVVLVR